MSFQYFKHQASLNFFALYRAIIKLQGIQKNASTGVITQPSDDSNRSVL